MKRGLWCYGRTQTEGIREKVAEVNIWNKMG
jgi:hypothetical protein